MSGAISSTLTKGYVDKTLALTVERIVWLERWEEEEELQDLEVRVLSLEMVSCSPPSLDSRVWYKSR